MWDWESRDEFRHWRRRARDWGRQFQHQQGRMRDRMFGRGDLKYVVLDLLKDQPRHGYDIIRELENRSGGFYTPSAGVVYPTLQLLEDMGAVTSEQQEGRKVYTITAEGRRILDERRDVVDEIAGRVRDWMHGGARGEVQLAMREMGDLMALLGRESPRLWNDPDKLRAIREAIARTRGEIETILHSQTL